MVTHMYFIYLLIYFSCHCDSPIITNDIIFNSCKTSNKNTLIYKQNNLSYLTDYEITTATVSGI